MANSIFYLLDPSFPGFKKAIDKYETKNATRKEMEEHCEKYACCECPISFKCSLAMSMFGGEIL